MACFISYSIFPILTWGNWTITCCLLLLSLNIQLLYVHLLRSLAVVSLVGQAGAAALEPDGQHASVALWAS